MEYLKVVKNLVISAVLISLTTNSALLGERPAWREPNRLPLHGETSFSLQARGALLGKLLVEEPDVDLDGRLDVAVMVEFHQPTRVLPRRVFFPNYPIGSTRYEPWPFQLVLYDRNKQCVCGDLLQATAATSFGYQQDPRLLPSDWRLLQADDLAGIRLKVRLPEYITRKPGVYYLQAVFNEHINRPPPEDLSILADRKAWQLGDEDLDIFRSNIVRIVISEHVADSSQAGRDKR